MVVRKPIANKGGGFGVVAVQDIPRFSVVGVYPGYDDPLSGEHAKVGRPGPKYSLVDMNCADYFNRVFGELQKCITPFINEPLPTEQSNCAWIQETTRPEGRLSVMTVCDVKAGQELLIGYGPLYPRDYPYNYDAYAYHLVEGHSDPPCFALWHWKSLDEKESEFVCYVGYDAETDLYHYWETEEEAAGSSSGAGGASGPSTTASAPKPAKQASSAASTTPTAAASAAEGGSEPPAAPVPPPSQPEEGADGGAPKAPVSNISE